MSLSAMSEQWEILLVALILGAAHILSPRVARIRKDQAQGTAFTGGLSVGYVFLHLIPSLDASDHVVGPGIYFIALLGFVVFYGLDVLFQAPNHEHPTKYHAYLGAFFLYDALLIFTLGLNLPPTPILTLLFAVALALDVLSTDLNLQDEYGARFVELGRWVLLAGVATGYALSLVRRPQSLYGRYSLRRAHGIHDVSHVQRTVSGISRQEILPIRGGAPHVRGVAPLARRSGLARPTAGAAPRLAPDGGRRDCR